MRVLDLGCGSGGDLASWGVQFSDDVVGLDIDDDRLAVARLRFPHWTYIHGRGERVPFEEGRFDHVVSSVALPYMDIPQTLKEIHRILIPGGRVSLSLHSPSFALSELREHALPHIVPTLYRLYVLANGIFFHFTGKILHFVNGRVESCQTERGMRIALRQAGFTNINFRHQPGPAGTMFLAEARRV
jgi:ubiquinone/menaquinone biosynthesis C-methylase UbiE